MTTSENDFWPSGQWSWAGKDTHILLGVHAIRAMDLIRIKTSRSNPLLVEDVAADKVRQFLDIYDKTNHPSVSNLTVQRIRASLTKRGIRLRYGSNAIRSEEHTSELQSLMRISYAVFCLKKK